MICRAEKQKIRVSYNCQWFSYFTCRWCLWLFQSTLWRICHTICSNQGYKMHKPGLRPLLLRVRRSLDTLLNTKSCEKDPHAWQFEGSILVVGPLISIPINESSQSGIEFFWHSGENFPFRELSTFMMSFLTIWAALARPHASESPRFRQYPSMSCLEACMTCLPSGRAVRSRIASNTLSFWRVALFFHGQLLPPWVYIDKTESLSTPGTSSSMSTDELSVASEHCFFSGLALFYS